MMAAQSENLRLSVVIPSYNEEECLAHTVEKIYQKLGAENIEHEIVVVNDNSTDQTEQVLEKLTRQIPTLRAIKSPYPSGYGFAIRCGLENFQGDCVATMMADTSDSPDDLVRFYRKLTEGFDAVFGSRFMRGGSVVDYPLFKLILNRITNLFIRIIFGIAYNDVTNAFKMYRRESIAGLQPFLSHHFNMTVELPLKIIARGYSYTVVPNSWTNRKTGESKLKVKEMGSRYLFIILYCLIEKWLVYGDYKKKT
ncbi:glycosyltransferase family 2 protein [candidate division CSSED10-310 bacterium]|uniref:Glycosyltransferase family 2 protein n=1 Tax=candidate division CSSED10-310 bacterium TaxID=2855610 RepID=A0ABV6YU38_UNCC1